MPAWVPAVPEGGWNTLKMKTQTLSSHAVVDQKVPQLNETNRKLTPCHTGDNSNFRILESLFSLGCPHVTTVASITCCQGLWFTVQHHDWWRKQVPPFWSRNDRAWYWSHNISKIRRPELYPYLAKLWKMSSGMLRDAYWLIFCQRANYQCGLLHTNTEKTVMCTLWHLPNEKDSTINTTMHNLTMHIWHWRQ